MFAKHLEQSWHMTKRYICMCCKKGIFLVTQSIHMCEICICVYVYSVWLNSILNFPICNSHSSLSFFPPSCYFIWLKRVAGHDPLNWFHDPWMGHGLQFEKHCWNRPFFPALLMLIVWVPWHPKHLAPHQQPCLILSAPLGSADALFCAPSRASD